MKRAQLWTVAAAVPLVAGAFVAALGTVMPSNARGSVPVDAPVFTTPLEFDNTYFPFEAGAVKAFCGRAEGEAIVVVDTYLPDTREFDWGGGTVTCRTLREMEFESGVLVETSWNYFAQADDGTVYYFGEVVDNYEDGEVVDHGGSWLVGGAVGDDPEETFTVADPAIFMPANPEFGDQFMPEDVPAGPQELDTVRRTDKSVNVPAGQFIGCLEIEETHPGEDGYERKWYAQGAGVILARQPGEKLKLIASTYFVDQVQE